ncbi:AAEL000358-PA [Aedes aegypti]|uniref:AAEL000358-PA n=1 Tax=Aedes aegypti TaxID=7159 RepID=Q17PF4_AEDAE|nr:AAEL000358-PA [Aedes aegypti]
MALTRPIIARLSLRLNVTLRRIAQCLTGSGSNVTSSRQILDQAIQHNMPKSFRLNEILVGHICYAALGVILEQAIDAKLYKKFFQLDPRNCVVEPGLNKEAVSQARVIWIGYDSSLTVIQKRLVGMWDDVHAVINGLNYFAEVERYPFQPSTDCGIVLVVALERLISSTKAITRGQRRHVLSNALLGMLHVLAVNEIREE